MPMSSAALGCLTCVKLSWRRRPANAIQHVAALRRRIARDQKDGATKCDGATMFFMGATVSGNEPGRFLRGMFRIGAGSSDADDLLNLSRQPSLTAGS